MRGVISPHWIGGFFDADGSVCLVRRKRVSRLSIRLGFAPMLCLSQSDLGLLAGIQQEIGGGTLKRRSKAGEVNAVGVRTNRDGYQLNWSCSEAIRVMNLLRPFSIGKKGEIDLILKFYGTYANYTKGFTSGGEIYENRYSEMVEAGETCRASLKDFRQSKDTRI